MLFDIFFFFSILILNLVAGLRMGSKVKTFRQYALSNKEFRSGTIVSTLIMSYTGGSFLFYTLANTYTQGIRYIIPMLLVCVGFWLTQFIGARMGPFLNTLSVAEALGNRYGKTVRRVTALTSIVFLVVMIGVQLQVIPTVIWLVFRIQGSWIVPLAAVLVITYAAFGGIRPMAFTHALIANVLCCCIFLLIASVYNSRANEHQLSTLLTTHTLFDVKHFLQSMGWNAPSLSFLSLCLLSLFPCIVLKPDQFQKIVMSQSAEQAKRVFGYAALYNFLLIGSVLFLGVLLLVHNATLDPESLWDYILVTFTFYPAIKGTLVVSVLGLVLCTVDSSLNTAAVLGVHDIIKPLRKVQEKVGDRDLVWARICVLGIGSLAFLLTFVLDNLCQVLLLVNSLMMSIYYIPLLFAIFGFCSTSRAVLISMVTGAITVVVWRRFLAHTGIDSNIPGMLANMLVLLISHWLLPKR